MSVVLLHCLNASSCQNYELQYSKALHKLMCTVQNKHHCFDLFVYHDTWDEHIMWMQFVSTVTQPFWFRSHKLFSTCVLQSTLKSIMGAIYMGYFDNEINRTFLQLSLDTMSDLLKTFFHIWTHFFSYN